MQSNDNEFDTNSIDNVSQSASETDSEADSESEVGSHSEATQTKESQAQAIYQQAISKDNRANRKIIISPLIRAAEKGDSIAQFWAARYYQVRCIERLYHRADNAYRQSSRHARDYFCKTSAHAEAAHKYFEAQKVLDKLHKFVWSIHETKPAECKLEPKYNEKANLMLGAWEHTIIHLDTLFTDEILTIADIQNILVYCLPGKWAISNLTTATTVQNGQLNLAQRFSEFLLRLTVNNELNTTFPEWADLVNSQREQADHDTRLNSLNPQRSDADAASTVGFYAGSSQNRIAELSQQLKEKNGQARGIILGQLRALAFKENNTEAVQALRNFYRENSRALYEEAITRRSLNVRNPKALADLIHASKQEIKILHPHDKSFSYYNYHLGLYYQQRCIVRLLQIAKNRTMGRERKFRFNHANATNAFHHAELYTDETIKLNGKTQVKMQSTLELLTKHVANFPDTILTNDKSSINNGFPMLKQLIEPLLLNNILSYENIEELIENLSVPDHLLPKKVHLMNNLKNSSNNNSTDELSNSSSSPSPTGSPR